ncbi:CYTH domain-containing protein [Chitinophagales bacterium]|nr:CYTH domain-containing protein [Chitinophagales bacterium]
MGLEIERKYLVQGDAWRKEAKAVLFVQGYILAEKDRVVRIRLEGEKAKITIKQELTSRVRNEYEYAIPVEDAEEMLENLCAKPLIKKHRHFLNFEEHEWVIDEFMGENEGLIVAELELNDAEQEFPKPQWLGEEVTEDKRYYNAVLSQFPFKRWAK